MKKILILLIAVVILISVVAFNYISYNRKYEIIKKYNLEFEANYQKEIYGTDLTTIINKVINNNEKNNVEKGQNKQYIDNGTNSINIDIKMIDTNEIYTMETFYNGGIEQFVQHYGNIKFKCTKLEHHKKTGQVKYLYFEQISK